MKSIILSFIIIALFFLLFTPSVQTVINTSFLHYFALIVFVMVVVCAIYFVGVPKINLKVLLEEILKKEENNRNEEK